MVEISLSLHDSDFTVAGEVIWSSPRQGDSAYDVGVQLVKCPDAFKVKMMEQVVAIELYRKEQKEKFNRDITLEKAAHEWIQKSFRPE